VSALVILPVMTRWLERVAWASSGAAAVHWNQGETGIGACYLVLGVVALGVARWV
jgi:hypothetical protein